MVDVLRAGLLPLLAVLICVLLPLWFQPDAAHWAAPSNARLGWVATLSLAWLIITALIMRRAIRPQAGRADRGSARDQEVLVVYASQTGVAEDLARRSADALAQMQTSVRLVDIAHLDVDELQRCSRALFVVSTTGEGDAPDAAFRFVAQEMPRSIALSHLHYGVLALGDREYHNFCAFGHRLDAWLRGCGAKAWFDTVEVDNLDGGALRHWQHQLSTLTQHATLPDWSAPQYGDWLLQSRQLLNPGSQGEEVHHIVLKPGASASTDWQAGDIAEIGPENSTDAIAGFLEKRALDGTAWVRCDDVDMPLHNALRNRMLIADDTYRGVDARDIARLLPMLAHREYSIASIASDGQIDLLVRTMRDADGHVGIGSGWLGQHAAIGARIALRVRRNRGFHAPVDDRPIILIGNGTGLAGLRALMRERLARGHRRNWLIFGERNRHCDYFWRDELEGWLSDGWLQHLDLAFSREQPERVYVQHRLQALAPRLREWAAQGAAIYVCGSLQGMAPGVDAVLRDVLGDTTVAAMIGDGRYRRDVY
jgi:sulfite reductase (NADPH) flavoprotein alpha-component